MKTIKNIGYYLTRGTFVGAVLALAILANSALAQEKGAERLVKLQRLNTVVDVQNAEVGNTIAMSCPKCKDSWVKVAQSLGKGGVREIASVQRHECPTCSTQIVTQGMGKQAKDTVKHVCKMSGSEDASCCTMKNGADSAPGMGKHNGHQN